MVRKTVFFNKFLLAAGMSVAFSAALPAQTGPTFEVASIKPAEMPTPAMAMSGKMHIGMKIEPGRVDIGMFSLADLISKAYEVKSYQVSGPSWLTTQRFDILAKMPEGAKQDQVPQMLQALLAERFKLTIHKDSKEQSVYAMVVGKGGPKMEPADPDAKPEASGPGDAPPPPTTGSSQMSISTSGRGAVVSDGRGGTTKMGMSPDGKSMRMEMSKVSMDELSEALARFVDRPVVNQTGLQGNYKIALDISMESLMAMAKAAGMAVPGGAAGGAESARPADAASDPSGGSIFNSIQALGLKLEAKKAPVVLIVVDHVEKTPTEN